MCNVIIGSIVTVTAIIIVIMRGIIIITNVTAIIIVIMKVKVIGYLLKM